MPTQTVHSGRTWLLWLALYVTGSLVVGLSVSFLILRSGAGTTSAVLMGGGSFGGSFGLCLALPAAVRELKRLSDPNH
ncbi:hypothetical protein ACFWG7_03150 [Streptomyces koyangensis]|uniref:Uncharacterized protein n=1 Tax=Streptomyces koyangensis TaxID=188770 RepID=A0A385DC71_9ACTN|nr:MULTISPECIES: hypothetical protein [Streptomyces]AXQ55926.1 hypothetical protein D0C37_15790 [Streptomyces koyangensis]PKR46994.1 hypothetical protein CWE27_00455 [Streptomyces sp. EAG2]